MNAKILLILSFAFFFSKMGSAQTDTKLAAKIESAFQKPLTLISDQDAYLKGKQEILSAKDISLLKRIIDEKGLPTNRMVGEKAAHQFWSLVMQCNEDIPFQVKVMKLMKPAVDKELIDESDFAMLVDRVRMNMDQPQLYGTQYVLSKDNGEAHLYKTIDTEKLCEMRKALNLPEAAPEESKIIPRVKGTAQRDDPKARY